MAEPAGMQNVQVERDGHLAVVTVNRPSKLNALDDLTIGELGCAFAGLEVDDGVGAIIVTGAGEKAFVAGADLEDVLPRALSFAAPVSVPLKRFFCGRSGSTLA